MGPILASLHCTGPWVDPKLCPPDPDTYLPRVPKKLVVFTRVLPAKIGDFRGVFGPEIGDFRGGFSDQKLVIFGVFS